MPRTSVARYESSATDLSADTFGKLLAVFADYQVEFVFRQGRIEVGMFLVAEGAKFGPRSTATE